MSRMENQVWNIAAVNLEQEAWLLVLQQRDAPADGPPSDNVFQNCNVWLRAGPALGWKGRAMIEQILHAA